MYASAHRMYTQAYVCVNIYVCVSMFVYVMCRCVPCVYTYIHNCTCACTQMYIYNFCY